MNGGNTNAVLSNTIASLGSEFAHEVINTAKAPIRILCAKSQHCAKIAGTVLAYME